ncbi:endonuclease [Allohahella marinimesophila]|uniref:Endonuclease I n=1 Tax=Allohahella marinimesophila TaxID=1054972 RepID=A0ABP7NY28_9GAMM
MMFDTTPDIRLRKLLVCLFAALALGSTAAFAAIENADLERWDGQKPQSWTTIDSGIVLARSTSIRHQGGAAASVLVTTNNQGNTDFRQALTVEAGQVYEFAVWVRHTEGGVRARLYADGYRNYSDPTLTGRWQKLSHRYRAEQSGAIEVGLRFYDIAGFDGSELVYVDSFAPVASIVQPGEPGTGPLDRYYSAAEGKRGAELKEALFDIINTQINRGYAALWSFFLNHDIDRYYENDGSILDIYSENPATNDPHSFRKSLDQCGTYRAEGDCYNREHSFPKSWFGRSEPMNSDVHHIFAVDGYVNGIRSSYPYGEVGSVRYVTANGSKVGPGHSSLGYGGTVFEPRTEFKGDLARAQLYMAIRYQHLIAGWEGLSPEGDAALSGAHDQPFEPWYLRMLVRWHAADPVSQKERDRNSAAFEFQGNRNPLVDYPQFAELIWDEYLVNED